MATPGRSAATVRPRLYGLQAGRIYALRILLMHQYVHCGGGICQATCISIRCATKMEWSRSFVRANPWPALCFDPLNPRPSAVCKKTPPALGMVWLTAQHGEKQRFTARLGGFVTPFQGDEHGI